MKKKDKKLQLNKEIISSLDNDYQHFIKGGAPATATCQGVVTATAKCQAVGPSLSVECPDTVLNIFTIGKCCDIDTLSDNGCGTFTRGKTCPSCI